MVSRDSPNSVGKALSEKVPAPDSPLEETPHKARVERDGLMAAASALIEMTAQCRSAAANDGIKYLAMHPCKVRLVLVPKSCRLLRGRCRPPRGWASSSLPQSPGALHLVRAGHLDGFQRTGNRMQMAAGQMQVECSIADLGM